MTLFDSRYKGLPDSRLPRTAQQITVGIPVIPVTEHRDPLGIGSPYREVTSGLSGLRLQLRTQLFVQTKMTPFVKQIEICFGEDVHRGYFSKGGMNFPNPES